MFHRVTLVFALLAAGLSAAHAELPAAVAEALTRARIPEQAMGSLVIRLSDGATLQAHHPERSLQPASTMKLVSTIVGLNKLGPLFRGQTVLESNGEIHDATLHGDLVLRGGADFDLNSEAFQSMLQTLRTRGIRQIAGNLVIDRGLYQPARLDLGLAPFDEAPEFRYNTIPDALGLNLNLLQVTLAADLERLSVHMLPEMENISISHDMQLVDGSCKGWDEGWLPPTVERKNNKVRIVLHGSYPKGCTKITELNVLDRTEYAGQLFRTLWKQLGGKFNGQVREALVPERRVLAQHNSRPLAEILRDINKRSDNTLARLLFLNMGTYAVDNTISGNVSVLPAEPATTLARSEREVRGWFREHGIDDTGLVLENGSGLSRSERITPTQMAALLQAGYRSMWAPELLASLPLGGMDGTMRNRLKNSPAAGLARIKTGSLKNVVAVAGYVPDAQGRQCIVVGLINFEAMKASEARAALDALIDWVAHSGS